MSYELTTLMYTCIPIYTGIWCRHRGVGIIFRLEPRSKESEFKALNATLQWFTEY